MKRRNIRFRGKSWTCEIHDQQACPVYSPCFSLYRIDKEVIDTLAQKYANSLKIDYPLTQFCEEEQSSALSPNELQTQAIAKDKECGFIHYDCTIAAIASENGNNVGDLVSKLSMSNQFLM